MPYLKLREENNRLYEVWSHQRYELSVAWQKSERGRGDKSHKIISSQLRPPGVAGALHNLTRFGQKSNSDSKTHVKQSNLTFGRDSGLRTYNARLHFWANTELKFTFSLAYGLA